MEMWIICTEHPLAPMSSPISLLLTQPLLMVMVWNTTVLPPVSLELSAVALSEPSTLVSIIHVHVCYHVPLEAIIPVQCTCMRDSIIMQIAATECYTDCQLPLIICTPVMYGLCVKMRVHVYICTCIAPV